MSTQTFQKGDRVVIGDAADYSASDGTIVYYRGQLGTVHDGTRDVNGDIKVVPDGLDTDFDDWVYVLPQHLTLESKKVLCCYGDADTTVPWAVRGAGPLRTLWAGQLAVDRVSVTPGGRHGGSVNSYPTSPQWVRSSPTIGGLKQVNDKVDEAQKQTNGSLTAKDDEVAALTRKLLDNGIDPQTGQPITKDIPTSEV